MPTPITIDASVNLDFRSATAKAAAFQKQFQAGFNKGGGLKGLNTDIASFESAIGRATNRIVSLGAAAVVFNTLRKAFSQFAESTIDVEQSLARINVNLGQTTDNLKQFSGQIFNIARATGTTFEDAAKGAEELARQGLGAEETLKRLKDALVLSRIAGIDSATAVDSLTAAINSFNREALTSTDVVNRFAAVDTKFAVSTKDLEEAVSRVGSSAAEAGVSFNELLAVVTSVQQTTARGGATIGNALKTIFTRVGRPEVLEQLQNIGVAVKDVEGNTLPAIRVLQNLATVYDDLSASQKNVVSRQVAGTFQINILKAALADLNKEQSTYNGALKAAANAGDAANKKNEQLNKTLKSSIEATKNSVTQLFANLGSQDLGPLTKAILDSVENARKFLAGENLDGIGETLGKGLLKGIANVISGPGLLGIGLILAKGLGKVVKTIASEAQGLLGINDASSKRAEIQSRINTLIKQATAAEYSNLAAATSILKQKEAILAISARIRQTELIGTPLQNAFLGTGILGGAKVNRGLKGVPSLARSGGGRVPNFARGHAPNFAPFALQSGAYPLGEGSFGTVFASHKRPSVVFKKFLERPGFKQDITDEFNVSKTLEAAGVPVAKVLGSAEGSVRRGGIFKEKIKGFLGNRVEDIGFSKAELQKLLGDKVKAAGLEPEDLSGNNFMIRGNVKDYYNMKNQVGYDKTQAEILKNAVIIDPGLFRPLGSAPRRPLPTFADPLYEAIRREKAAGIPEHQIYVDRDPRVAGPGNPQGLLVANKRDEPAGGHQGVDRVLSQGGNPKRAGMVGNFARKQPLLSQQEIVNQRFGINDSRYDDVTGSAAKAAKALDSFQAALLRSDQAVNKNADAVDKSAQTLTTAKEAAAKFADIVNEGKSPFVGEGQQPLDPKYSPSQTARASREATAQFNKYAKEDAGKNLSGRGLQGGALRLRSTGASVPVTPHDIFTSEKLQSNRDVAFNRAIERFTSGKDVTKSKLDLIKTTLTERAQNASREVLNPGVSNKARSSYVKSTSAKAFQDLEAQRQETFSTAKAQSAAEIKARRSGIRQNASLIASFVLPAAAGFIPEGKGGTAGGQAGGAISGALQGAGTGAILGPVGAGIGAAIGGLVGYFNKLTKSVEEYNEEVDKSTDIQLKSINAVSQFVALGSQLSEADNASPEARTRIASQRAQALTQVDPEFREALSKQGITQEETNKILLKAQEKGERIDNTRELNKQGNTINDKRNGTLGSFVKGVDKARGFLDSATQGSPFAGIFSGSYGDLLGTKGGGFSSAAAGDSLRGGFASKIKDKGGLSKEEQGFLSRSAGKEDPVAGDLDKLNKILESLGDTTKATDDTFQDLVDGLSKGQNAFRSFDRLNKREQAKINERPALVNNRSFLGADLGGEQSFSAFGQQRRPGVFQTAGQRNARDTGFLGGLNRLDELGAFDSTGGLKSQTGDIVKQQESATARASKFGLLSSAKDLIGGFDQFKGIPLTSPTGSPNESLIKSLLERIAKGSDQQAAALARVLSDGLKVKNDNLSKLGQGAPATSIDGIAVLNPAIKGGGRSSVYAGNGSQDSRIKVNPYGLSNDYEEKADRKASAASYFSLHQASKGAITVQQANANFAANKKLVAPDDSADSVDASVQAVADANKAAAQTAETLANATLKISLDVQGLADAVGGEEFTAKLQSLIQDLANLNNKVDANAGRPNPPTLPPKPSGYRGSGKVVRADNRNAGGS